MALGEARGHDMMIRLHNMIVMSWNVVRYDGCILQQPSGYIPCFDILNYIWRRIKCVLILIAFFTYHLILDVKYGHVFLFVFLKNPLTFAYCVNVFKKILKKYLRDRNLVKIPYLMINRLYAPI